MQNQLAMSELSLLHSQFPHLAQWIKLKLDNGEEVEGQIFTYDKISNVVVLQQKCKPENGVDIPGTTPKYNFRIIKISYIKEISIPSNEKESSNTTTTTDATKTNDAASTTTQSSNKNDGKTQANNSKSKNDTATKNTTSNPTSTTATSSKSEENSGDATPATTETTTTSTTEENSTKNKKNPNDPYSNSLSTLVPVCPVNIDDIITREKKALKEEFQRQNRIGVGVTEEAQQIFDALSKTMPCSWNNKSIVVMDEVTISPPYSAENCKMVPGKSVQESILERVQKVLELEKKKIRENKKK
ncbi:hypothetical protein BCR32DRAFT_107834 [Anaeromyces robustus]|uniref:AD domain-containing protein n=1 Tax=Anaeromyces robustus TaxID=1754192 RepID=A0A1Y1W4H7_9FUNG|nr:hypothetical protein BCR32DRAFT_107834 [Anaeromyces robustus]|eukprot:ORX68439.1 hypothetical protein BCR32DRAFT_107834 [Anaeromyces robustus]